MKYLQAAQCLKFYSFTAQTSIGISKYCLQLEYRVQFRYRAFRHRVPGILKFGNVGQTPLGNAAVFGLFLGAGILGMDYLPLKWQGRIDLHQHHQHRQAIESLKFYTSFLPLTAGNSEADLMMHCASCIATSTTSYNQQLPHKTSAILIYPKSLQWITVKLTFMVTIPESKQVQIFYSAFLQDILICSQQKSYTTEYTQMSMISPLKNWKSFQLAHPFHTQQRQ